ncbi:hypothetical protein ACS0TY_008951 [Phlomoides rotata]
MDVPGNSNSLLNTHLQTSNTFPAESFRAQRQPHLRCSIAPTNGWSFSKRARDHSPRHSSRKIIRIGCLDGERRRKDDSTRSNSEDSKSTEKMRHLKSLVVVARSRLSHRLSHSGRYVGTFLLSGGETEVQREVRRNTEK